jgi:hypothetical protein
MVTSVQDRDQAARPRARWAATVYRWGLLVFLLAVAVQIFLAGLGVFSYGDTAVFGGLHALDGLLIAVSAGVQYVLVRRP